jgi:hypothetical protein
MPRPNGLIWKYFTPHRKGKYKSGVCKFCGDAYITNATRMRNHITNKCQKVPDNVKKIVSKSKLPLVPAVSELEPRRLRELSLNNAKTYGEEYSEIEQEDDDNMTQSEIDGVNFILILLF